MLSPFEFEKAFYDLIFQQRQVFIGSRMV